MSIVVPPLTRAHNHCPIVIMFLVRVWPVVVDIVVVVVVVVVVVAAAAARCKGRGQDSNVA